MEKRSNSAVLKYILDRDVAFTKNLVAYLLQFASFKSLRIHCNFLEFSCHGVVWLVTWLAFIWFANSKDLYQIQLNMIIGLLMDIFIVAVLKAAVRRRRPTPTKDFGPDKFSFPSGHASRAFFVLLFFTNLSPVSMLWWMPLTAWACSVAISRLVLQRHFILDVTAGAMIGIIEALILKFIWIGPETAQNIINFISEDNLPGGSE